MKWLRDKMIYRALLFSCSFLLKATVLLAGNQPLRASQQYDLYKPAVVMVKTEVSATVYVRQVTINQTNFNQLLDSIHALELDSIFLSSGQKLDIVLRALQNRASHYFRNLFTYYRHVQKVSASGTGFFFSSDGYLLTNCHVISENDDYIKHRFILSAFNDVTESNIASIESAWAVKFSEEQRSSLYQTFANIYSKLVPIVLQNLRKHIYVVISEEDPAGQSIIRRLPASIVIKGQSMPGKDVAILKVSNGHEFPVLPIGMHDAGRVGDDVYVYGYPDPVNRNSYLSEETMLDPTLTRGIISAWKISVEGWPVMQMDAIINHGNSGGPVTNKDGEVIGITTFGSLDDDAMGLAPGLNFAIPLDVLRDFIRQAGIPVNPGRINNLYSQALILFENHQYRKAARRFDELSHVNPGLAGIFAYKKRCKEYIRSGNDASYDLLSYFSLLIILSAGIGFAFFAAKRQH